MERIKSAENHNSNYTHKRKFYVETEREAKSTDKSSQTMVKEIKGQ